MITRGIVTFLYSLSLLLTGSALNPNLSQRHLSTAFECNGIFIPIGLVAKAVHSACRKLESASQSGVNPLQGNHNRPFPREYDSGKLFPNVRGKAFIYPLNLRSDAEGSYARYNVIITRSCALAGVIGKDLNAEGDSSSNIQCKERKTPFALVGTEKQPMRLAGVKEPGFVCGIQFYPLKQILTLAINACHSIRTEQTSPVSTLDGIDPIIFPQLERNRDQWFWNLRGPIHSRNYMPEKYNPHKLLLDPRNDHDCGVTVTTTSTTRDAVECIRTPIRENLFEYYRRIFMERFIDDFSEHEGT